MGDRVLVPVEQLQRVRANDLKTSIADTYAAADRAPVAIAKGRGLNPAVPTHVLMSVSHYRTALSAAPSSGEGEPVAWIEPEDLDHLKLGWRAQVVRRPGGERYVPLYAHPGKALSVEEVADILAYYLDHDEGEPDYSAFVDKCREAAQAILAAMGRAGE